MKADKYYKADLKIAPWLKDSLIGSILMLPHVAGLEVAVYANGKVRFLVNPTDRRQCHERDIEPLILRVFRADMFSLRIEGCRS